MHQVTEALDHIKGAMIGFGIAKAKEFLSQAVPGLEEHLGLGQNEGGSNRSQGFSGAGSYGSGSSNYGSGSQSTRSGQSSGSSNYGSGRSSSGSGTGSSQTSGQTSSSNYGTGSSDYRSGSQTPSSTGGGTGSSGTPEPVTRLLGAATPGQTTGPGSRAGKRISATNSPAPEPARARRQTRLRKATSALAKNQDVLPGKVLKDLLQPESFRFQFGLRFFNRHLVLQTDGDVRVFFSILQQNQPAVALQFRSHFPKHLLRLREFMIDVHHQDQVECVFRKPRVTSEPRIGSTLVRFSFAIRFRIIVSISGWTSTA